MFRRHSGLAVLLTAFTTAVIASASNADDQYAPFDKVMNAAESILVVLGIVSSPLYIFFGWRIFKITLFTLAGASCALLVYSLGVYIGFVELTVVLLGAVAFVIGGALSLWFFAWALFLVGAVAGAFLLGAGWHFAAGTDTLKHPFEYHDINYQLALVICALAGGIAISPIERYLLIGLTAGLGSACCVWACAAAAEGLGWLPTADARYEAFAIAVLFLAGCAVQLGVTGREHDGPASDGFSGVHPRDRPLLPTRAEVRRYCAILLRWPSHQSQKPEVIQVSFFADEVW